jgi:hypothetical protein
MPGALPGTVKLFPLLVRVRLMRILCRHTPMVLGRLLLLLLLLLLLRLRRLLRTVHLLKVDLGHVLSLPHPTIMDQQKTRRRMHACAQQHHGD